VWRKLAAAEHFEGADDVVLFGAVGRGVASVLNA